MAANPDLFSGITGRDLVPVTPSDTVDLAIPARALRIGGGGTLRFTSLAGVVRNTDVSDSELFLVGVLRVHSTGTTATDIEAVL